MVLRRGISPFMVAVVVICAGGCGGGGATGNGPGGDAGVDGEQDGELDGQPLDGSGGEDSSLPDADGASPEDAGDGSADGAASDSDDDAGVIWECQAEGTERPDFLPVIGCGEDFALVAAAPLDASIPGALSAKTVVDQFDDDALYFQNSEKYSIHWEFAFEHLSGQGKPIVPPLGQFNQTEYYSPDRRFLLGAVTFYEEPGVWVYEISPYDTASAEMITRAYRRIAESAYFGEDLLFHPTSQAISVEAAKLPSDVSIITTEELFAGITYQPLNLGRTVGKLRFVLESELSTAYVHYRDVVVLDRVPNDIAVVGGIITGELQTPLSHINVLSQNRGTPNMALIGALTHPDLTALDGKWVELDVGAFEWSIREATQDEADEWWEENKPSNVQIPNKDLSVTDLRDAEEILDLEGLELKAAIDAAIPAFGGKAAHYGGLVYAGPDVPHPKAFAVPVAHYFAFMAYNGFDAWIDGLLDDPSFRADPAVRDARLAELRDAMMAGFMVSSFEAELIAKLTSEFPGTPMRFRSSTNAEDLDGFTGAGLYTSKTGIVGDPEQSVADAVREVWSSLWYYRAFEEREYRSIDHRAVGMALLVHPSSSGEYANGVALTANIFDTQGLEPGFYVNVQRGESSVVKPPPGITTDSFVYYYYLPGQPMVFLSHSNLIPAQETVLTVTQAYELGRGLDAIHSYFAAAYGPKPGQPAKFYAMDVEFKFKADEEGVERVEFKQARPHPGWGL